MRYIRTALFCLWLPWSVEARTHPAFPSSPVIEQRAQFWEKIFSRYPSHQIVIHDKNDPSLILGVIQLRSQGFDSSNSPGARRLIQSTMQLYNETLRGFAQRGPAYRYEHGLASSIWNACGKNPKARARLLNGQLNIRGQGGLSDTFKQAYRRSEVYLPRMERIFRNHGLPPELTRIVFVESMFNIQARSKVGASGLWQLMPNTARAYLRVNRRVDERNSPLKATEAAARILRGNYAELGNWPLAITAYNHGLGGMKRAVNQTGSTKLSDIIQGYRSPSFGFASSNFYAEFLAALRVHAQHEARSNRRVASELEPDQDPGL